MSDSPEKVWFWQRWLKRPWFWQTWLKNTKEDNSKSKPSKRETSPVLDKKGSKKDKDKSPYKLVVTNPRNLSLETYPSLDERETVKDRLEKLHPSDLGLEEDVTLEIHGCTPGTNVAVLVTGAPDPVLEPGVIDAIVAPVEYHVTFKVIDSAGRIVLWKRKPSSKQKDTKSKPGIPDAYVEETSERVARVPVSSEKPIELDNVEIMANYKQGTLVNDVRAATVLSPPP